MIGPIDHLDRGIENKRITYHHHTHTHSPPTSRCLDVTIQGTMGEQKYAPGILLMPLPQLTELLITLMTLIQLVIPMINFPGKNQFSDLGTARRFH